MDNDGNWEFVEMCMVCKGFQTRSMGLKTGAIGKKRQVY